MNSKTCSGGSAGEAEVMRRSVGQAGERVSYLALKGARAETDPTILLIHGAGVSARSWTNQLGGLGDALRVLAIDLPGHGESDPTPEPTVEGYAEAARRFLEQAGTGPVFVAGHSLGGAVAQALAARHPERVRGLVLLSTCAKLPQNDGSLGSLLAYLPGAVRKFVFFLMAKKLLFAPGASRQAILLGIHELRTCRPETILNDVAAAKAMDLEAAARGLQVPTLVLCGSRDRLTPPVLSERLNALVQGSRLEILEGAGHMLPLEAPEEVNQKILDFVKGVVGSKVRRPSPRPGGMKQSFLGRLVAAGKQLLRRESG